MSDLVLLVGRRAGDELVLEGAQPCMPAQVGIMEAIELLFLRLLQLSPGVRPRFAVVPGRGVEVHVAVFLGEVRPKLAEHAEQTGTVRGAPMVKPGERAYAAASGPSADLALVKLRDHLREGLRLRIESDRVVWDRVGNALNS